VLVKAQANHHIKIVENPARSLRSRANLRRAAPVDMYGEAKFGFHSDDERGLGQDAICDRKDLNQLT
jgi:hypothetical protein